MATMDFKFTLTDGSVLTASAAIPDASVPDILAYAGATFPQQSDALGILIERTPENLIRQWMGGAISDFMARVHTFKQQQAASTAAAAVSPIAVTIT